MKSSLRLVLATVLLAGLPLAAGAAVQNGYIEATDLNTSGSLGFIGTDVNSFGEYIVTNTIADRLAVTFNNATGVFAITATNMPSFAANPLVGGITGFANTSFDLGAGSFNYAYLGGTVATAPGAPAAVGTNSFTTATGIPEGIESSIWSLTGNALTAQWTNSDLSSPTTTIMDITGILVLTGDPTTFQNNFGPADTVGLTFVSVPEPTTWALMLIGVGGLGAALRRRSALRPITSA